MLNTPPALEVEDSTLREARLALLTSNAETAIEARPALPPFPFDVEVTPEQDYRCGFYCRYGKRLFDLAFGLVLLFLALPIIAVSALAVLVTSGWPVFYRTRRLGRGGKPFTMWKLRTMLVDADDTLERLIRENGHIAQEFQSRQKLRHDPRVTAVGKFLRKTSLDELPQLFNVIAGDMSLVGPRPYLRRDLSEADEDVLGVPPAMTGPWQVKGRNELAPSVRVQLDREYVRNVTFAGDLWLLLQTVKPIIRANGC